MIRYAEPAPAKLNLALHVRGKRPDGRHEIETVFAFCSDGDLVEAEVADALSLSVTGPFADQVTANEDNLVLRAAHALREASGVETGAALYLRKTLPVASGIGGGSADAAAALRLLTRLWHVDPAHASAVAPTLGADVPACLLSLAARGTGAGNELQLVDDPRIGGRPALLVNPLVAVATGEVFGRWSGLDRGPLEDWETGRNDLEAAARELAPVIGEVLEWLGSTAGAMFARMSGSGATCFALFEDEQARDAGAERVPSGWWHLATHLR